MLSCYQLFFSQTKYTLFHLGCRFSMERTLPGHGGVTLLPALPSDSRLEKFRELSRGRRCAFLRSMKATVRKLCPQHQDRHHNPRQQSNLQNRSDLFVTKDLKVGLRNRKGTCYACIIKLHHFPLGKKE